MARQIVLKGVDLSHWNKFIKWDKLAKEVDFVMLKIGGEEGKKGKFKPDPCFLKYYKSAVASGLHVGGYFFAGNRKNIICADYADIRTMCFTVHNFLIDNEVFFDMPLAIDFEDQVMIMKEENTRYVSEWCNIMEKLNYYVTIYASDISGFYDCLEIDGLSAYDKWVARYKSTGPEYVKEYGMWQYTPIGNIKGVAGSVDMDYAYLDYPDIISRKGLNRP